MEAITKFLLCALVCLALSACESPLSDVKDGANAGKTPANKAAPTISTISDVTAYLDAAVDVAFTIRDSDSTLDCKRSVTVTSSNQTLLPATYQMLSGVAPSCVLSLHPAGGVSGSATVTVTVYDGSNRASSNFHVQVQPPAFSAGDASANEGSSLSFPVQLSKAAASAVTVTYATVDGTAVAGVNYTSESGTITFAPGETSKTLTVPTRDDGAYSGDKAMTLNFVAFNATVTANGTIQNVDAAVPVAADVTPAAFDEDTESGLITLSYSVANGALATSCSVSSPTHVTVTQPCACDGAGVCTLKVTGTSNYHGAASFAYKVHANGVDSNSANASLTVNSVLDAPVANDFSPAAFNADTQSGLITLNYTAVGGDLATSCAISSASHVSVTQPCACDGAGVCTLKVTGAQHYSGAASFQFTVSAGTADSNTATASLTVNLVKTYSLSFTGGTTIDPAITYSRSGGASRVNSSGYLQMVDPNVARVDYDPNALTLSGFLLEESRTNLLRFGSAIDSVAWSKAASSAIGNTTTSPDGAANGDKLVEDSSSGSHEARFGDIAKPAVAAPYTFSVFAKAAERTAVRLYFYGASFGDAAGTTCALTGSGSVSSTSATGAFANASARVEKWPNGWYRCVVTGTSSAATVIGASLGLVASGSASYSGNGTSGAYFWGAQLEQGAGATSLVPDKNMLTNSEQLDQAPWVPAAASVSADAAADPGGGSGAELLTDDNTLNFHFAYQVVKIAPTQMLTYSFYAKAGTTSLVMAQINDDDSSASNVQAKFDLANGVVSSTNSGGAGNLVDSTITAVGNGWYRCSVSGQANTSGTSSDVRVYVLDSSGNSYYTGSGNNAYVWGQQLETGSSLTSYWSIGQNAVRGADQAYVGALGPWFDTSSGTIVATATLAAAAASGVKRYVSSFNDGTAQNLVAPYFSAGGGGLHLVNSSAAQTDSTASFTASGTLKLAVAYQSNDLEVYAGGVAGTASSSAAIPTVSRLTLGSDGSGNYLNGYLKLLDYYPIRVTNTQLGTLSQ